MTFVSPAEGRVTSQWGHRHLAGRAPGFHRGIDIAPPIPGTRGHPVYAAYGGTVRAVEANARPNPRTGRYDGNPITGTWNTGNYVLIDGPGGGSEWYGHLATITVRPGQRVEAGDLLGTMGESGNVSGIHLHFECWNGRVQGGGLGAGNTRDPRIDFARHNITPGSPPRRVSPATTPAPSIPELEEFDMSQEQYDNIKSDLNKIKTALEETQANSRHLPPIRDRVTKTNHAAGRSEIVLAQIARQVGSPVDTAELAAALAEHLDIEAALTEALAELPDRDNSEIAAAVVSKIANRLQED